MSTECNRKTTCKSTPRRLLPRPRSMQARTLQLIEEAVGPSEGRSSHLDFPSLGSRQVLASFDGGDISSDGGAPLLRKVEELTRDHSGQFATCFTDHRNPDLIEHLLEHLVAQRVCDGLALGYEDLSD